MSGRLTNQDHEIAERVIGVGMPMRLERSEELEGVAHRFGGAIRM